MEVKICYQNRIENSEDGFKQTDREDIMGYSRGILKENDDRDDFNIEESSYKWLEVEKTEGVKRTNVDSPLDGVGYDSQVDCDSEQREYMTQVLKCSNDIKKERIDPEAADYLQLNCEDDIIQYDRKEVIKYSRGVVKQNIDDQEAVDIEEFSYKWLKLEKTEDVKEEANADILLDKVGCDSQYREQMACVLNSSWYDVNRDNGQTEHDMSEVLKFDNDIKKEKSDPEVVIIDRENFLQDGTENNENVQKEYDIKAEISLEKRSELKHISKKVELHQCQFCDYKCKFDYTLKQHLETKHSQTADWHYCEYCEYKAKDRKRLMFHFKCKHDANAKCYKCNYCDYKTKNKANLSRHNKTRHDQNSEWHNCQHCAFKTKHKMSLQAHLEFKHNIVSEKGRLHQCQFCDYICKFKIVLTQHLKTKHS